MLRNRIVFILVAMTGAALPAQAATVREVSARVNYFDPARTIAESGDSLRWQVVDGNHDVVTYAGDAQFASPLMNRTSSPYTRSFDGGSILYRCRPHSAVTGSGVCVGMCGTVTDQTGAPGVPTVTSPGVGQTYADGVVPFRGAARAWDVVRVREGEYLIGEALSGADGSWMLELAFGQGQHEVVVTALAPNGLEGPGRTVRFSVGEGYRDITPPSGSVTSDSVVIGFGRVVVDGTARDDVGVRAVFLEIRDVGGAPVGRVAATCESCPAPTVGWIGDLSLAPGVYTIDAVAIDTSGNESGVVGTVTAIVVLPVG